MGSDQEALAADGYDDYRDRVPLIWSGRIVETGTCTGPRQDAGARTV